MTDFIERDVPVDVRERITETVHREMAEPARRGLRMPLAVAASVAVLAVAGVVTALSVHDRHDQAPAGPTHLPGPSTSSAPAPKPASGAADEIDRCWNAVVAKGKQSKFPPRSKWASVARQTSTSANVTALRGNGKTFFCMTTTATVTVTDPTAKVSPVPGTPTRVMLVDDSGWILAVGIDPNAGGVTVRPGEDYEVGTPAVDGVLLIQVEAQRGLASNARFVGDNRIQYDVPKKIPPVPAPAAELVDRPLPPPDRTSDDGRQLGDCLDNTGWPKSYADQWQPGMSIKDGQWYAQLAVSKDQFGMCVHTKHAGRYNEFEFTPLDPVPASTKPQYLLQDRMTYSVGDGFHQFAVGTVTREAKKVTVTTKDGVGHPALVRDGRWAVVLPADDPNLAPASVPSTVQSITVEDGAGKVRYDGPPIEVRR